MNPAPVRYRAVSMALAADLEMHQVEMRILAENGKTVAIACARDSIFEVKKHIEQLARACPEIATWSKE
jgi:hypothetical protein